MTLSAGVSGNPAPSLQWFKNGAPVPGATGSSLRLTNVTVSDSGAYQLRATNTCGQVFSATAVLTVNGPGCTAPQFTDHPDSRTVAVGGTVTFSSSATGSPAPAYQWFRNGAALAGATNRTLTLTGVGSGDAGSYNVRASNSCGQATSSSATLTVTVPSCKGSPGLLQGALVEVLKGRPANCNWLADLRLTFPNSMGGGSYNKPVLAAAIALVTEPIRSGSGGWNMYDWWDLYLRGEVGMRGKEWYFGGKELTSGVYQHYNMASVLAVHHIANERGRTGLRDLARRWLRATWAIQSMAALPARPLTIHDRGNSEAFGSSYSGPFVAIAGMRSPENHWRNRNPSILFARATGMSTNFRGEASFQADLREELEGAWSGGSYPYSLYGLRGSEATALRNVVNQHQLSGTVTGMLAGIHTIRPMHLVGWPGVRVTLIEENANNNTAPTFGTAYFASPRDANGRELHVLYPWLRHTGSGPRPFRRGITAGEASPPIPRPARHRRRDRLLRCDQAAGRNHGRARYHPPRRHGPPPATRSSSAWSWRRSRNRGDESRDRIARR